MGKLQDYKNDFGITKKRYSRSLISKFQIISGSLLIIICMINLLFRDYLTFIMKAGVIGLLIIVLLLLVINTFILKVEKNDERGRANAYRAGDSAFLLIEKAACVIFILFLVFNNKFPEILHSYNVMLGLVCLMTLGLVSREFYFLKYENSEV